MIALFLIPIYLILNCFIIRNIIKWLKTFSSAFGRKIFKIPLSIVYFALAFSPLIVFLFNMGSFNRICRQISNYWFGILLYTLSVLIIAAIIGLILRLIRKRKFNNSELLISGTVCFSIIALICAYGIYSAKNIKTTDYNIKVEKKVDGLNSLKIALVADLHLGYNIGLGQMQDMAEKINDLNPDIVIIAGDIFDNSFDAIEDSEKISETLKSIKSKYGTYACLGNHDIEEKILAGFTFDETPSADTRMIDFINKSDIKLLCDDSVLIDDKFYVCGRLDYHRQTGSIRKTPEQMVDGLDKSKPIIMIDHEPRDLQELSDVGIDIDFCGHTHNGQLFPGNIIIKSFWENAYGYLRKGNMHNIVTSGVGLFGPNMRVGTIAEICNITVDFE